MVEKSENKIKCVECKSEFKIKENDFKLKKLVKKQLDENLYFKKANRRLNSNILSDVRRTLNNTYKNCIPAKFFEYTWAFTRNCAVPRVIASIIFRYYTLHLFVPNYTLEFFGFIWFFAYLKCRILHLITH